MMINAGYECGAPISALNSLMTTASRCAECGKEGGAVSRCASPVCRSSIATLIAKGIIGRRIKINANTGNIEQAIKHWTIGASAGCYRAMYHLISCFKKGAVGRESINSTYNSSCAEMRNEARDGASRIMAEPEGD